MTQFTLCRVCACSETTCDLVNIFEKHGSRECIAEMLLELAGLKKHFEATHANAIYGWKSFGISEISLFDTTTDDEDEVKPTTAETKKNKNMSQNVLCCGCSMTFDTDAELRRHAETVHAPEAMETDEYRPFQCNLCYHVFTTPKGVAEHQSAKRVMRYQCATCGVRCGKYHQLLRHEHTHTSERFACDCCEKNFSNTFALRKHKIARHQSDPTRADDEKRHICNQCGKCLHSAEYLKQHMKLHSDHQAYSCPLCDARFKLKVYLRWHMAKHKGTYNCRPLHPAAVPPVAEKVTFPLVVRTLGAAGWRTNVIAVSSHSTVIGLTGGNCISS
uniref:C2H2-type domain-containing protein n=1 Tax=Anopheles farauti TaxID=69004 RepID=A0A182R104_9DIPT